MKDVPANTCPPVESYLDRVLLAEGGFVDHPCDKGGATNRGISLAFAKTLGLGDEAIRALTLDDARALYKEHFYQRPKIALLPQALQEPVFDWGVNSGPHRAICALQQCLNDLRAYLPLPGWNELIVDGVLGPRLATAADIALAERGPACVIDAYIMARCAYYAAMVRRDPSQAVFIRGWLKRASRFFISPRKAVWNGRDVEYRA